MIFVDFKSAYNTVKRDLLYDILSKRNILQDQEIQFLKYLQGMVHFEVNGKLIHF